MPELPEVETARRGIAPHVEGQRVVQVVVREPRLRWPIPASLARDWQGCVVESVRRRAKYLLLDSTGGTSVGTAILHLGMSGSLRIVDANRPADKHDHVDVIFNNGKALRLTDPRRFGALLWTRDDPLSHPLLSSLGPEPLTGAFDGQHLWRKARGRRGAVKNFIMDNHVVVGVGNIYASESLFRAGIHPKRAAGRVSAVRFEALAVHIKAVLAEAIKAGGTTLKDFVSGDGKPGYFRHELNVYDREGDACELCASAIKRIVIGQRASYYCPQCQR